MTGKWKAARNILITVLFVALFVVFIQSAGDIVVPLAEYRAAQGEYRETREVARRPVVDADAETADDEPAIAWAALREIGPEIIAWIEVPGTRIDYPIVQGRDNDWYLRHTVSGERNPSGAVFVDYRSAPDFSAPHTIIYGHNMQDGSMFAGLHGWDGDRFVIHTLDGRTLEYIVFARYTVSANDPLFAFASDLGGGAQVVTLSTCVFRRGDLRYVVHGKLYMRGGE